MTDTPRILLVEDSAADAKLIIQALEEGLGPVHTERVEDALGMRAALLSGPWSLIISDWSLPTFSGLEALELMKGLNLDLPFILASGTIGEEGAVDAMRAGARDYVLKDRLARLAPAVLRELKEAEQRRARLQAEQALRESEARFARLSESGIIGIVVADLAGRTLEANDAYLHMTGYGREELLAGRMSWAEMTPPESREADELAGKQLLATGFAGPWDRECIRKDGSRVSVLVGVAMLDETKCISFVADVTLRKTAESALRRTEEQLRQAQKMEAIGILAGGVAHDFNNVLSVILSYSELLLQALRQDDPMRADVSEIKRAGERAAALTRQLLSFSRQQVLDCQVIDLNASLRDMERMLRRIIREDVEFTLQLDPALGRCLGDVGHIEQIIMNLVVNARDAMPDGGELAIETQNVELDEAFAREHHGVKPGPHIMIAVRDTGVGMDKQTQARIFEPFFTTKEKGKGTGLGLSTVFGIAEQSGGTVWVDSELGQGTTFNVYFPRTDEAAASAPAKAVVTTLRGSETILLVEDEEQIRQVARGILERNGYRVIEASTPGEALLKFEQHGAVVDLLLTDVVMPQMSGKQLADRLLLLRPLLRVLFMSGYTDREMVGQLSARAAFLQKPLRPSTLTRKVREVLDTPSTQRAT